VHHITSGPVWGSLARGDGTGDGDREGHICSGPSAIAVAAFSPSLDSYFTAHNDAAAPTNLPHAAKDMLTFVVSPQSAATILEDSLRTNGEREIAGNGFMLGNKDETTWTCVAPGAQARLAW